jgi:hypothetical protein
MQQSGPDLARLLLFNQFVFNKSTFQKAQKRAKLGPHRER